MSSPTVLRGRLVGTFDPDTVTAEQLGAAMTGANTPENATTVDAQEEAAR